MFRTSLLLLAVFLCAIILMSPDSADTIPAFARKYGFSCSTCHVAAPKLKDYGDEFAGNGFQLPDEDEPIRAYKDAGDDLLLLQRQLPLAIRFDAYTLYNSNSDVSADFQTPFGVKLMSGGNIAKDIGYYFYFYMNERGEVAGLEDAYVHFNNLFDSEFDIMVGQFQISDPLFKRELRLTYEDYMIYTVVPGSKSNADLKYDRGIMATYSLPTQTDIVVEILNGNGIGEAGDDHVFDSDAFKNVFVKVSQGWKMFSLGMFAYSGNEKDPDGTIPYDNREENVFLMYGPDAGFSTDRFELNLQYLMRTDDNPDFLAVKPSDEYETSGAIAEFIVNPFPESSRLFGVILYNSVTSDYPGMEYESLTGHVSYLLKRNFRLIGEVTQNLEDDYTRVTAGFMTGF